MVYIINTLFWLICLLLLICKSDNSISCVIETDYKKIFLQTRNIYLVRCCEIWNLRKLRDGLMCFIFYIEQCINVRQPSGIRE